MRIFYSTSGALRTKPATISGIRLGECRAKSSRNAERNQIGTVGDIIPDSRATPRKSASRGAIQFPARDVLWYGGGLNLATRVGSVRFSAAVPHVDNGDIFNASIRGAGSQPMTAEGHVRTSQHRLTAEDVRVAYRLFLGREPESDSMIEAWQARGSYDELCRMFLASTEFRAGHPELTKPQYMPLKVPPLEVEWQADEQILSSLLARVRSVWTRLGEERPHWSVLSADEFSPGRISETARDFFASGAASSADLLGCLARHRLAAAEFPRIFEFGCGLARVTAHLARLFDNVTACDVSASHLAIARRLISAAGLENVSIRLVESTDFGMTEPFDLWFSQIVLQHNPPPIIALILRRSFSLLAPGGVAVFQVPTYAAGYRFRIADYLAQLNGEGSIEMHVLPQHIIFQLAREGGCEPLEVWHDDYVGQTTWISNTFMFRKPSAD